MMLGALVAWSRGAIPVWATDAFCGPCFHRAMSHLPTGARTAPSCPECPGMASTQHGQWDRQGGDPSLEGWSCPDPACKKQESQVRRNEP